MRLVFPGPRAVECHNFDVVITDLGMPYIDARQVAAVVKDALRGILLTGWGQRLVAEGDVSGKWIAFSASHPRCGNCTRPLLTARWRRGREPIGFRSPREALPDPTPANRGLTP